MSHPCRKITRRTIEGAEVEVGIAEPEFLSLVVKGVKVEVEVEPRSTGAAFRITFSALGDGQVFH